MNLAWRCHAAFVFALLSVISAGAQAVPRSRPLARGIADVEARIARDKELARALQDAMAEHVQNIGEIVYGTYGQKGDPAVALIKLKQAYQQLHDAVESGATGQWWAYFGQLNQAILDCWSDTNSAVQNINALQQVTWEALRTATTLGELNGYNQAIATDTARDQYLLARSAEIQARQSQADNNSELDAAPSDDNPVVPIVPPGVDLTPLDDAVSISRWLDLRNRAFRDQNEEDNFYKKFPAYQKFKDIAEIRSPSTDVTKSATECKGDWSAFNAAQTPGALLAAALATSKQIDACEQKLPK